MLLPFKIVFNFSSNKYGFKITRATGNIEYLNDPYLPATLGVFALAKYLIYLSRLPELKDIHTLYICTVPIIAAQFLLLWQWWLNYGVELISCL
ncbi:hypothetical protein GGS24DRAFT_462661 [Hypoxylon argillaceum]|nr:hypothetical protein GGS24DRAFT_462661 [Hypoxylon argillaceum]